METSGKVVIGAVGCFAMLGIVLLFFIVIGMFTSGSGSESSSSPSKPEDAATAEPAPDNRPVPPNDPRDLTVFNALLYLRTGQRNLSELRRSCSYVGVPSFVVESIIEDYVIYKADMGSDADLRIAIRKEPGRYYGEGQPLSFDEHINIVGQQEFKTLMDTTQMIPEGRYANPHQAHCR